MVINNNDAIELSNNDDIELSITELETDETLKLDNNEFDEFEYDCEDLFRYLFDLQQYTKDIKYNCNSLIDLTFKLKRILNEEDYDLVDKALNRLQDNVFFEETPLCSNAGSNSYPFYVMLEDTYENIIDDLSDILSETGDPTDGYLEIKHLFERHNSYLRDISNVSEETLDDIGENYDWLFIYGKREGYFTNDQMYFISKIYDCCMNLSEIQYYYDEALYILLNTIEDY